MSFNYHSGLTSVQMLSNSANLQIMNREHSLSNSNSPLKERLYSVKWNFKYIGYTCLDMLQAKSEIGKDLGLTLFFGILSIVLGMVQFDVPGVMGASADLREIPLLISIFYIKNPIYILIISAITAISTFWMVGMSFSTTFLMHLLGMLVAWIFYNFLKKYKFPIIQEAICWVLFVGLYYSALLIPILVLSEIYIEGQKISFAATYISIMQIVVFEMIPTSLVSGLYLVQYEARLSLEKHKESLEITVKERTQELTTANNELQMVNEELISSNEEVGALNENLERIVEERTQKINIHLDQLNLYAHMNAHEVRAPLARILGLLHLIKMEKDEAAKQELLDLVFTASEDLDNVVKKMNRLLEIKD